MDNLKFYDSLESDEWISLSEPVMAQPVSLDNLEAIDDADKIKKPPKSKNTLKAPIVTFQLLLCVSILLLIYISKLFLPDVFTIFKSTYDREINSSMFSNGDFKNSSYLSFFTSTPDEAR